MVGAGCTHGCWVLGDNQYTQRGYNHAMTLGGFLYPARVTSLPLLLLLLIYYLSGSI